MVEIETKFYEALESKYIPQQIFFDEWQTLYLLAFLPDLRDGVGPFASSTSPVRSNRKRAPFEFWCEVAAELDIRLAHTEEDSYFVEDFCCKRLSITEIARQRHKSTWEVRSRIERAIDYIASGRVGRWLDTKKRKGVSYKEWKGHRRY